MILGSEPPQGLFTTLKTKLRAEAGRGGETVMHLFMKTGNTFTCFSRQKPHQESHKRVQPVGVRFQSLFDPFYKENGPAPLQMQTSTT